MEKTYKAVATVTNGEREWEIVIYSGYKTAKEASDGIERFLNHGYTVTKTWIVEEIAR